MKVISHSTVTDFWQAAGPLFAADPVRHTVAMTVIARLLAGGRYGEARSIFLTVHDGADVIGAAFCTPPFPIGVSALPARAAAAVADYLVANGIVASGASGMRPEVEAFAAAWAERTGATRNSHMDQRLYRLGQLAPPTEVDGEPAMGRSDDIGLLADWQAAFRYEAGHHGGDRWPTERIGNQIRDTLAAGGAYLLWRADGRPVSLAAASVPRNGMSRIGPVYTPEEFRGRGYGSAVTAAASQWAMDKGADHVVLFTDLSNPVSNSIYQRIGFVPVADALAVTFTPVRLP